MTNEKKVDKKKMKGECLPGGRKAKIRKPLVDEVGGEE